MDPKSKGMSGMNRKSTTSQDQQKNNPDKEKNQNVKQKEKNQANDGGSAHMEMEEEGKHDKENTTLEEGTAKNPNKRARDSPPETQAQPRKSYAGAVNTAPREAKQHPPCSTHHNYKATRQHHLGFVVSRSASLKSKSPATVVIRGSDGKLYMVHPKNQEKGHMFRIFSPVIYQKAEETKTGSLPYGHGTATYVAWTRELTGDLVDYYKEDERRFMTGVITALDPPNAQSRGGRLDVHGRTQGGYASMRFWMDNLPELHLEVGMMVTFGAFVRSDERRFPTIDLMEPDMADLEKGYSQITNPNVQLALQRSHLAISLELGTVTATSLLPGFPAALGSQITSSTNPIANMLRVAENFHAKQRQLELVEGKPRLKTVPRNGDSDRTVNELLERRLQKGRHGYQKLNVMINTGIFTHCTLQNWMRYVDNFFLSDKTGTVNAFYLLVEVDPDTDEENALSVNDFTAHLSTQHSNRLKAVHLLGQMNAGMFSKFGEGGHFSFPKLGEHSYALLELGSTLIPPVCAPDVQSLDMTLDEVERASTVSYQDSCPGELVNDNLLVYVTYEEPDTAEGKSEITAYLKRAGIKGIPAKSKARGWNMLQVRTNSNAESADLVARLLQEPKQGENPLLVYKASDYKRDGPLVKFNGRANPTLIFTALTGRVPMIPIGERLFKFLYTGDVEKLVEAAKAVNDHITAEVYEKGTSYPPLQLIQEPLEDGVKLNWLTPPPAPPNVVYPYCGRGPGRILVKDVNFRIGKHLVKELRNKLKAGKPVDGELAELVTYQGQHNEPDTGLRISVPEKEVGIALGGKVSAGKNTYELFDGDELTCELISVIAETAAVIDTTPIDEGITTSGIIADTRKIAKTFTEGKTGLLSQSLGSIKLSQAVREKARDEPGRAAAEGSDTVAMERERNQRQSSGELMATRKASQKKQNPELQQYKPNKQGRQSTLPFLKNNDQEGHAQRKKATNTQTQEQ